MQRDPTRQLDQAVAEVLTVMLNLACTSEPFEPRREASAFAASVLFSGSLDGICTLAFDYPTATQLAAGLVGLPPACITTDLCADTAGELCNMIAGSWKSTQSHTHDACHISCPTVATGEPTRQPLFGKTISRLYRFAGHHFSLVLSFN